MDHIAEQAGVAKTTLYRRWPSKGALIVDCLLDAFGPVPVTGSSRQEIMSSAVYWIAAKIGERGVGAAFAGVFSDAVSDAALREILASRLQEPYRLALREALDEPDDRVLLFIDVVTGCSGEGPVQGPTVCGWCRSGPRPHRFSPPARQGRAGSPAGSAQVPHGRYESILLVRKVPI
jgi:AcrR family transcriptional regulator